MSKIFPKIYLKFDLKCFHPLSLRFYYCVATKQVNNNNYYITTYCIPYNTYSYSYIITVTFYQMCPYFDSGMTSNSWFRRLIGILALVLVGAVEAKGLGHMVNLSPSPSNI